jgi:hypothetical protein
MSSVVVASYTTDYIFKVPQNIDLNDENVIKSWYVKWALLNINYTNGDTVSYEPEITQDYHKYPESIAIEDAEDFGIDNNSTITQ